MDVSGLSQGMQNILVKMTREDPNLRYATISELKRDVEKSEAFLFKNNILVWDLPIMLQEGYLQQGILEKKRQHWL